jgi:hypothetical protein
MVVPVLFESNWKIGINTITKSIDGSKEGLKRTNHTGTHHPVTKLKAKGKVCPIH